MQQGLLDEILWIGCFRSTSFPPRSSLPRVLRNDFAKPSRRSQRRRYKMRTANPAVIDRYNGAAGHTLAKQMILASMILSSHGSHRQPLQSRSDDFKEEGADFVS